ncbi:MAG: glycosyltransferase [Desulfovibrionaceae bacterium]|nr:glycosyltransferase [Desulfovibrionaceae bacterium]
MSGSIRAARDRRSLVILPDNGQALLRRELALAFASLGFGVIRPRPEELDDQASPHYLPRLLDQKPSLFFSVNLEGILGIRQAGRLILSAGIPALAWFVDNPWHILSGARDPSWKELALAVTDHSFITALETAGAKKVLHLPLAAGLTPPPKAAPPPRLTELRGVVFAGRTAFPGREEFFRGQKAPEELLEQARTNMDRSFKTEAERPDFAWWVRQLGLEDPTAFWPGKKARLPGLGAAMCNAWWRASCLIAVCGGQGGLTLFGDAGWREGLLPELYGRGLEASLDLRGPLDYYGDLPFLYQRADFSLNLNSLLLPAGLSQRIYDVWAAGGFCLTDWNPGLDLFPEELTREVTFHAPGELPELAARLRADPSRRERLRRAWQAEIQERHNYTVRLGELLERVI